MVVADQSKDSDAMLVDDLQIRSGGCSVRGIARPTNEDGFFVDPDNRFFVVTDGMGGQRAGAVASRMAIRGLSQRLKSLCIEEPSSTWDVARLADALCDTNQLVLAAKGADPRLAGMGATAVVAAIQRQCLFVAGLGDSRGYLIREGRSTQLTTDHSVAQSMADAGMVSVENLKSHPFRNVLHRYLGCAEIGDGPCVRSIALQPNDRILLVTDGLSDRVSDDVLAEITCRCHDPYDAVAQLKQRAIENGATDDITCVAVFADMAHGTGADREWLAYRAQMV